MADDDIVKRVEDNCLLLYWGYHEKVDYVVRVAYHRNTCKYYGKSTLPKECECPVVDEKRVRNVKRPGYLTQLRDFAQHKDTDRNPKAERGAPRVKVAGRPPGDMGGFFALDEILCDITMTVDRVFDETGRDRNWVAERGAIEILRDLHNQVKLFLVAGHVDGARTLDGAVGRWLAAARTALRCGDASAGIFDGVVCGNCGGGLSTPWANRGDADVVCIGSPGEPPCGESYPPSEWITLYEGRSR